MEDDVRLALDDESRYGLRRAHAVQAGRRVDCVALLERLGTCEEELLGRLEYEEYGIWHLRVYWKETRIESSE